MELKINESKVLEFNTIVEGEAGDLSAKIRISIGDLEIGFPAIIENNKIQVKIPPLKDYIKESRLKSKNADIRLDIIAKGKVFTPWKDKIDLEIPLKVKAEMTDIKEFLDEADNFIKVSKVKDVDEIVKTEEKKVVDEGKSDKKKSKFLSIMLEEKKCPEGEKY